MHATRCLSDNYRGWGGVNASLSTACNASSHSLFPFFPPRTSLTHRAARFIRKDRKDLKVPSVLNVPKDPLFILTKKNKIMLQFSLQENLLTPAPNDMMAQPVNVRTYGLPEINQRILARNPGLGLSQLNASIEEFFDEVCAIVEDGGSVNTPLFNTQPSVPGVFDSATDNFDPRRHRVRTNLMLGTRLRKATAAIKVQKVQTADPAPFILEVHDVLSDTTNELLTPGGVVQIRGGRLKFVPGNPANGIFLIDEQAQPVRLDVIVENKPARLIAMLPADLPLEVRTTLIATGREGKTLKTGRFIRELTIAG